MKNSKLGKKKKSFEFSDSGVVLNEEKKYPCNLDCCFCSGVLNMYP